MEDSRLGWGPVIERRIKVGTCGGNGGGVLTENPLLTLCEKSFGAAYHQINLSKGWAISWYAAPPKKIGPWGSPAGWRNYHGTKSGLDGIGFGTGLGIGIGLGDGFGIGREKEVEFWNIRWA